ncbi:MAG TPA: alpha-galactosidase, partial [Chloroflexota bacterium]|nr:alpha-galactosidase [Chloroflexota bacterium]
RRSVDTATPSDCRDQTADDGTRTLEISRAWSDGLTACQTFVLAPGADEIQIALHLRAPRQFAAALRQLIPLCPPGPSAANLQLAVGPHGWQVLDLGWSSDEPARLVPLADNAPVSATGFAALTSGTGSQLTLAFLEARAAIGQFWFAGTAATDAVQVSAAADFGTIDLYGEEQSSGTLWLSLRTLPAALERFAEVWRSVHPSSAQRLSLVQWLPNDLDEGNGEPLPTNEREILNRLGALAGWPVRREIDAVTLAAEWAEKPGDWWVDPERFPNGLPAVTQAIHRQEYRSGVTLTPLLVAPESAVCQNHPTWLVRGATGDPIAVSEALTRQVDRFVLDASQSEVREWLAALGQRLAAERFGIVQLEALAASVVSGWRASGPTSPLAALVQAMESLRGGFVGGTSVASGTPLLASLDRADVVVSDVRPLRRADPSPLLRAFLSLTGRTLGAGILALDAEGQSLDEARAAATVACFAGGAMTLAGELADLPTERSAIARACLPPFLGTILPIDLGRPGAPRLFVAPVHAGWDEWLVVLALNASTSPIALIESFAELGLPDRPYHAFEFWSQTYLGILDRRLIVEHIAPGGCAVVGLKAVRDHPQLVGTSLHVSLGATGIHSVRFNPAERWLGVAVGSSGDREGTISLAVPRGWSVGSLRGTGGEFAIRMVEEHLAQIHLRFRDVADLEVGLWKG